MILNLVTVGICFIRSKKNSLRISGIWIPFIIFHMFSLFLSGNISTLPYWLVCAMLLYIPVVFYNNTNLKLLLLIGFFFAIGIFFQLFLPSQYYSYVFPLFIGDASEFVGTSLDREFGFSGFSYQTGSAAYTIIMGLIALLAFGKEWFAKRHYLLYPILLVVMVFAVILTGKRMPTAIAVFLVMINSFLNASSSSLRKYFTIIFISVIAIISFNFFVSNIDNFSDNILLKRFVTTYETITTGGDASSGRSDLYQRAWELFDKSPIVGIGAGNYSKLSGMGTSVHNVYLQVLCEEGVFGVILYIIPLIVIFFKTWKFRTNRSLDKHHANIATFSLLIQVSYILYSLTGNCTVNINNFVMYFIGVTLFLYVLTCRNNANNNRYEYSIVHK